MALTVELAECHSENSTALELVKFVGNIPKCSAFEKQSIVTIITMLLLYAGKEMTKSRERSSHTWVGGSIGCRRPTSAWSSHPFHSIPINIYF